jgi:predicted GNAT superfamily acetyltransferase
VAATIRLFETNDDYRACVELQRETWGAEFRDCVPPAMLMISQKMDGVAAGAFDAEGVLLGFVYGLMGWKDGERCHWSHMLAVKREYRDRGIGQDLKAFQRAALLSRGVSVMYWTYDPLVARNAYLNLQKLGVDVVEYVPDMYGDDEGSTTDSVIGSDRLVVRWLLQTEERNGERTDGRGGEPVVRLEIPADIQSLKAVAPDLAREWRGKTREAFQSYFARGYRVARFVREPHTERCYYILTG